MLDLVTDQPEGPAELQVVARCGLAVAGGRARQVVVVHVADRGPRRPERARAVERDRERDDAEAGPGGTCRVRSVAHRAESTKLPRAAMSVLLAFVAVAVVVIVTPGQDTALVIKNTLAGRVRRALDAATGFVLVALGLRPAIERR